MTNTENADYKRGFRLAWSPRRRDLDYYLDQYDARNDDAGYAAFEDGWIDALETR